MSKKHTPSRLAAGLILMAALGLASAVQAAGPTAAPEGAELYFITPADGATVSSPVTVHFGLRGMGVAPAGVEMARTGHHHLLINAPLPPLDKPIPADAQHVHFGGGQTEVTIELPAGTHELQLLLGDHLHVPHNPPVMSERITITVQ